MSEVSSQSKMTEKRDLRSKSKRARDALEDLIGRTEEDGYRWELKNALKIQKVRRLFDLRRVDPHTVKNFRTLPVLPKEEDKPAYKANNKSILDDNNLRLLSRVDYHVLVSLIIYVHVVFDIVSKNTWNLGAWKALN